MTSQYEKANGLLPSELMPVYKNHQALPILNSNESLQELIDNFKYPNPYECSVYSGESVSQGIEYSVATLGLPEGILWHIKYFPGTASGNSMMIAYPSSNEYSTRMRVSDTTSWGSWETIFGDEIVDIVSDSVNRKALIYPTGKSTDDEANGWYKVADCAYDDYNDNCIIMSVMTTFAHQYTGIFEIHMRADNGLPYCCSFNWLSRIGFDPNNFKIAVDTTTKTWTLYYKYISGRYSMTVFKILSESGTRDTTADITLYSALERVSDVNTEPAGVIATSVDGASVANADTVDGKHASEFALIANNRMNSYTALSQIGCTTTSTLSEVWSALPNSSEIFFNSGEVTDESWNVPYTLGLIHMTKLNINRHSITIYPKVNNGCVPMYMCVTDAGVPDGQWNKYSDGGNANKLDGKDSTEFTWHKKITTADELNSATLPEGLYDVTGVETDFPCGTMSYYSIIHHTHNGYPITQIATMTQGGFYRGMYYRIYDKTNGVYKDWRNVTQRTCIVAQASSANANPYYKVASINIPTTYQNKGIVFHVTGSASGKNSTGILRLHARTEGTGYTNPNLIFAEWEYISGKIDPTKFIMAFNTNTTPAIVEFWVKIDTGYTRWQFDAISEYTAAGAITEWVLYDKVSAGSEAAITEGFTTNTSILPEMGGSIAKVNGHTVESDVPANAKFTDTTYSNFVKSGSGAKAGLVPAPSVTAGTTKYLREDGTWQVPPDTNTDTKVTNTLNTTAKAYITGTTSATTNTGTQVFDTGVYLGTTAGELVASKFTGALNGNANTATNATNSTNVKTTASTVVNQTDYYPTFADSNNNSATNESLKTINGYKISAALNTTSSTNSNSRHVALFLGNDIPLGTAGSNRGSLCLYGQDAYYSQILSSPDIKQNCTLMLPPIDNKVLKARGEGGTSTDEILNDYVNNVATGGYSVAGGYGTKASGWKSAAWGESTIASGRYSVADGLCTTANVGASHVFGKHNKELAGIVSGVSIENDCLVVGNGTSSTELSNAFRVNLRGETYGLSAFNSSGADYAEFIKPWYDNNPNNEDRVGYFVTIKDGLLYKASEGDYISGITSGNPSIIGNADEDYYWRYERDEFNRFIYEDLIDEIEEPVVDEEGKFVLDDDGKIVTNKTTNIIKNGKFKVSDTYDPSLQENYVERKYRPEWSYVGMIGVIPVRDDGTCVPGQFCKCGVDGIATKADVRGFDTFFVIERISDNIISVELR